MRGGPPGRQPIASSRSRAALSRSFTSWQTLAVATSAAGLRPGSSALTQSKPHGGSASRNAPPACRHRLGPRAAGGAGASGPVRRCHLREHAAPLQELGHGRPAARAGWQRARLTVAASAAAHSAKRYFACVVTSRVFGGLPLLEGAVRIGATPPPAPVATARSADARTAMCAAGRAATVSAAQDATNGARARGRRGLIVADDEAIGGRAEPSSRSHYRGGPPQSETVPMTGRRDKK